MRRRFWLIASLVIALGNLHAVPPPPLRVIFGVSGPLGGKDSRGGPAGFAFDVLTEAARRAGVPLTWQQGSGSVHENEQALRDGKVDLLPAAVVTAARKVEFYVTEPWWTADLVAVVLADGPNRNERDLNGLRLALTPNAAFAVQSKLDKAALISRPDLRTALRDVCDKGADAAIFQATFIRELLLVRPDVCSGVRLRTLDTEMEIQFGLISANRLARTANALKTAIDELTRDGTLETIARRHPTVSSSQAGRMAAMLHFAQQRRTTRAIWLVSAALVMVGAVILFWQHHSRQRLRRLNLQLGRTQGSLEAQVAELKTVFETLNEAVFISDINGHISYWNRAATVIFDLQEFLPSAEFEELADHFELYGPDNVLLAEDDRPLARVLRGETIRDVELFVVNKKAGRTRIIRFSGALARDTNGNALVAVLHARDETDNRANQKALQHQEDMLRVFSNNTQDSIFITDTANRFLFANPAALRAIGRPLDEVIGRTTDEVATTAQFSALMPTLVADRHSEGSGEWVSVQGESRTYLKTQTRWRDDDGNPAGIVGVLRDVTELNRNERRAREWQQAFEEAAVAISLAEPHDGTFRAVNEAFARERGYTQRELAGRPVNVVYPEREWVRVQSYAGLATERGHLRFESVQVRKDGSEFPVLIDITMTRMDGDGSLLWVSIAFDQTENKRNQAEIVQLNLDLEQRVHERTQELERANRELEAFSYSVSHDLRAPLRGIEGWSQALLDDYGGSFDERGTRYLNRVRSEARRMKGIIDKLLELSRLNQVRPKRELVNMSALAHEIAGRIRESQTSSHLEVSIQPELSTMGDRALLGILLTNLLENAVKFTSRRSDATVEFGQIEVRGLAVFYVRDNGEGFDMAQASNLFGVFQRLHSQSDFPGSGIGLATVQRIVHRHGGRIWADAKPRHGATFYSRSGPSHED